MKLIATLVGLCVLLLGGVQAQTPDVRAAREELMKLDRQFDEATAAHGLSGWLEFFAEDAVIFPTGEPIVRGLKAIREHYDKTGFSPEGLRWKPAGADVSSSGDLGYTYGTWELAGKGPDGKPLVLRGKYTTIWKKQADGRWKVVLDIGNNEPPRRYERLRATGHGGGMSHPEAASPRIRILHEGDIAFALAQTAREGWDSTPATLAFHIAHGPDGCFIAEVGGEPAGMVTTTRYRRTGWIGNLILTPERRGLGIGTQLMEHAIRHLDRAGAGTIRLEADPLGVNIYRRLGFEDEFDSPRFRRESGGTQRPASVALLGATDLDDLAAFDEPYFGDDRARLLWLLLEGAPAAFRVPAEGKLAAYLIVQPSAAGARVGPWVASDIGAAGEILDIALRSLGNRTVILAAPGPNAACRALLASRGFFETPSGLRMVRGPKAGRGQPENVYALATGAVG